MASKQTSIMAAAFPQFAAAFHNADTGATWNIRQAPDCKAEELQLGNSAPLAKDGIAITFKSRTEAMIGCKERAKARATSANIIAKEYKGAKNDLPYSACWQTANSKGEACWLFPYPAPKADVHAGEDVQSGASASAIKSMAANVDVKPASKPHDRSRGPQGTNAQRRELAALQAAQKAESDKASAEISQASA